MKTLTMFSMYFYQLKNNVKSLLFIAFLESVPTFMSLYITLRMQYIWWMCRGYCGNLQLNAEYLKFHHNIWCRSRYEKGEEFGYGEKLN